MLRHRHRTSRTLLRVVLGWLGVLLMAGALTVALPTPESSAATTDMTCWTAADGDDNTVTVDIQKDDQDTATTTDDTYTSSNETNVGGLTVAQVESIGMAPGGTVLYSANHELGGNGTEDAVIGATDDTGRLGTIDMTTGAFTGKASTIGSTTNYATYDTGTSISGGPATQAQTLVFADIDGLTFDPFTGKLWAIVRIEEDGSAPADYDYLIIIDPGPGTFSPDEFRDDNNLVRDAVPVVPAAGGDDANLGDIDDLAIDPATGTLYGVANASGASDQLVSINKATGRATIIGTMNVTDVEGLGFSNVGGLFGDFFATTGDFSADTSHRDRFWRVDTSTGSVFDEDSGTAGFQAIHAFDTVNSGTDYESMDCLVSNTIDRQITGNVYVDSDKDGVFEPGDGEVGQQSASVRLYIDNGTTPNEVDGGDTFVDNELTDANGFYSFTVSFPTGTTPAPRDFVLDISTNTLPGGAVMTDNDDEEASFPGDPPTSDDTGSTNGVPNTDSSGNNVNNNFGFVTAPNITKTSDNVTASNVTDPVLPGTDTIEYRIVLENTSSTNITTDIQLTDTVPTGLSYAGTADGTVNDGSDTPNGVTAVYSGGTNYAITVNDEFQAGGQRTLDLTFGGLDAGETMTVTFRVDTSNTISSSSIVNQACRVYNAQTICDSETDQLVGSIGDFVWNDADADVVQDAGEAGIADITVELLTSGGDGNCNSGNEASVATATTDASGNYLFSRLGTNEYCVNPDGNDPDMPAGYQLTGSQTEPMLVDLDVSAPATRIVLTADFGYDAAAAPPPTEPDPEIIDLELTKDVNPPVVNLGEEAIWTVTLTNASPGTTHQATGVTVQDDLPAGMTFVSAKPSKGTYDEATGMWDVGSMAIDEVQTLEIVVTVDEPGFHTNLAYVTKANQTDIDSQPGPPHARFQDDEDDATIKAAVVDLELTKDVSDPTVVEGQEFTFDITVENAPISNVAPITATNVSVADTVPEGLRVLRVSSTQGTFDTQTFIWFVGDLEVAESATLTLFVIAEREGTFVNVAQVVTCDQTDIDSTPDNDDPDEDDQDEATVIMEVVAALGDYVWLDKNGDGIQDADEIGIAGVTVAIAGPFYVSPPDPGRVQASAIVQTDNDGKYMFGSLVPGLYIVVIAEDTLPGQLARTTSTNSYEVQLDGGFTYLDADFGYQPSADPPPPEPGLPVTGSESDRLAIAGFSMLSWGALMILWTARRQPQPAHAAYRRRRRSPGNRRDPLKVEVIRPPGRRRWWHR